MDSIVYSDNACTFKRQTKLKKLWTIRTHLGVKEFTNLPQFKINNVVLIKDDNLPRNFWSLCKIIEIFPGRDGKLKLNFLKLLNCLEIVCGCYVVPKPLKPEMASYVAHHNSEQIWCAHFPAAEKTILKEKENLNVRSPRKSWKFMCNLSGGEKTLSSLSLVFALLCYRPTPFYVMGEIDAALHVRNVAIVGFFLKVLYENIVPYMNDFNMWNSIVCELPVS